MRQFKKKNPPKTRKLYKMAEFQSNSSNIKLSNEKGERSALKA